MVHAHCLTDEELAAAAFDEGAPDPAALLHTAACEACARRLVRLLTAARGLRLALADGAARGHCLDDEEFVAIVHVHGAADSAAVAHLADCTRCSGTLASLMAVLRDPGVQAQVLERDIPHAGKQRHTWPRSTAGAALLGAAVLAGMMLRPGNPAGRPEVPRPSTHREGTAAIVLLPRIVGPDAQSAPDTLRWTSVPYADRYQVLLFDRQGTLAWEAQTRDTVIMLPSHLRGNPGTFLWKVEARTDWNRWVASEWAELSIPSRP